MKLTSEQLREHYLIEKELANKLRHASREDRKHLYSSVYDEMFKRVPFHPMLTQKKDPTDRLDEVTRELRLLRRFLKPNIVFTEIGPGDCLLSFEICKIVKKVYAIDVSSEITSNKEKPENFQLIISDGTSIPLKPESIDVVYSNQLMEHLHYDDAVEQLTNILNCLVVGGKYVCITPNRIDGPHDVSQYFDEEATCFHLKEYTFTELNELFISTGFKTVHGYWGAKGMFLKIPYFLISFTESLLKVLPLSVRRFRVFRPMLPINIVGIK